MSLKYEPASEPLHIYVKYLFSPRCQPNMVDQKMDAKGFEIDAGAPPSPPPSNPDPYASNLKP